MLQDDGFETVLDLAALALYAEDGKDVSVLSHHLVRLHWVVVELAVVHELQLCLGVRALRHHQQQYYT